MPNLVSFLVLLVVLSAFITSGTLGGGNSEKRKRVSFDNADKRANERALLNSFYSKPKRFKSEQNFDLPLLSSDLTNGNGTSAAEFMTKAGLVHDFESKYGSYVQALILLNNYTLKAKTRSVLRCKNVIRLHFLQYFSTLAQQETWTLPLIQNLVSNAALAFMDFLETSFLHKYVRISFLKGVNTEKAFLHVVLPQVNNQLFISSNFSRIPFVINKDLAHIWNSTFGADIENLLLTAFHIHATGILYSLVNEFKAKGTPIEMVYLNSPSTSLNAWRYLDVCSMMLSFPALSCLYMEIRFDLRNPARFAALLYDRIIYYHQHNLVNVTINNRVVNLSDLSLRVASFVIKDLALFENESFLSNAAVLMKGYSQMIFVRETLPQLPHSQKEKIFKALRS